MPQPVLKYREIITSEHPSSSKEAQWSMS